MPRISSSRSIAVERWQTYSVRSFGTVTGKGFFMLSQRPSLDTPLPQLLALASARRDTLFGTRVTYSPKVFIPLTMLCRDTCGYCTFAQPPARLENPFLSAEQVLNIAKAGAK